MKKYTLHRTNRENNFTIVATCIEDNGVFIVKAGSIISPFELKGLSKRMKTIRDAAHINENNVLLEDVSFNSRYDATCFVLGTNASENWFKE